MRAPKGIFRKICLDELMHALMVQSPAWQVYIRHVDWLIDASCNYSNLCEYTLGITCECKERRKRDAESASETTRAECYTFYTRNEINNIKRWRKKEKKEVRCIKDAAITKTDPIDKDVNDIYICVILIPREHEIVTNDRTPKKTGILKSAEKGKHTPFAAI